MQLLIEDLLTFSRVGTQGRPFVETDLNKTARAVVCRPRDPIQAAGGTVSSATCRPYGRRAADPPAAPEPDLERDQVPPPGRAAGGRGRQQRSTGRYAEISVSDNGIGFDPRTPTASSASSSACTAATSTRGPESGSRSAARSPSATAARSSVDSTPGKGSVFTVTLPLQRIAEPSLRRRGRRRIKSGRW